MIFESSAHQTTTKSKVQHSLTSKWDIVNNIGDDFRWDLIESSVHCFVNFLMFNKWLFVNRITLEYNKNSAGFLFEENFTLIF